MKENIYKYIYRGAMGVLALSFVLMLFVSSTMPFGLSASWSTDGWGTSLVFTRPDATPSIGQKIAGKSEEQGKVSVFTVEETLRREGAVFYRVSEFGGDELLTMQAGVFGRAVVLMIPFMGVLAQMLNHILGVMTLIGLPLLMLFINYVLYVLQKIIPIITSLERTTQRRPHAQVRRRKQQTEKEEVYEKEETREQKYVTVLKPYNLRSTYSH